MSTNDTFLAIFLGSKTSARMTAWNALSEEARYTKMARRDRGCALQHRAKRLIIDIRQFMSQPKAGVKKLAWV
jgi:hypothetical protein